MLQFIKTNFKMVVSSIVLFALVFVTMQWVRETIAHKGTQIEILNSLVVTKDTIIQSQEKELERLRKSEAISSNAAEKLKQDIADDKKTNTAAVVEIKRQIAAIDDKYKSLPKTAVNQERKSSEIAVVRSKGLWATYCIQEPTSEYCKGNTGK